MSSDTSRAGTYARHRIRAQHSSNYHHFGLVTEELVLREAGVSSSNPVSPLPSSVTLVKFPNVSEWRFLTVSEDGRSAHLATWLRGSVYM